MWRKGRSGGVGGDGYGGWSGGGGEGKMVREGEGTAFFLLRSIAWSLWFICV